MTFKIAKKNVFRLACIKKNLKISFGLVASGLQTTNCQTINAVFVKRRNGATVLCSTLNIEQRKLEKNFIDSCFNQNLIKMVASDYKDVATLLCS